jgi:molybdate transport system permease protein
VLQSLSLSLGVVFFSMLVLIPFGTWLGWVQARKTYRAKSLVDVVVLLPLILPPSVVGYFLLLSLGKDSLLGGWLDSWFGVRLVFSFWGAVIAAAVVAFPMMVKGAEASFARVDKELEEAASVDGASNPQIFLQITLPLARRGLLAAILLTAGRALGEFGATLMFAGNLIGKTNTLPLSIYSAFMVNDDAAALSLALLLTSVSIILSLLLSRLAR